MVFLGLINLLYRGGLLKFSLFGLGIMPYITSSIIMQLLIRGNSHLERLSKKGTRAGRRSSSIHGMAPLSSRRRRDSDTISC